MKYAARNRSIAKYFLRQRESSKKLSFSSCVLLFYILLNFFSSDYYAQWKKLFDFDGPIRTVYFKDFTNLPKDGFVSTDHAALWKTLDGGITWHQTSYSSSWLIFSFSFKDSQIGWVCGFSNKIWRTTDGGDSWDMLNNSALCIHYVKSTDLVIGNDIGGYVYSSDGINFTLGQKLPGFDGGVSVTFSDELHGILSSTNSTVQNNTMAFTADGGLTWKVTPLTTVYPEFFQPVGIPNTKIFFAMCELSDGVDNVGKLIRSDDGGENWREIYRYPLKGNSVSGTMQLGSNMSLFFQTALEGSDGIMMSSDSGITFHSICGPINGLDTRFYVRDSFIYAGDKQGGLWLNTTGIGSNSTPILSQNNISLPVLLPCKNLDSTITFTFFDSCNNIQAKLLSANITGSQNFSFSSPSAIPRSIHPNDSLIISYSPVNAMPDTAALHLKFHLGWKDFDTTILLFGAGRLPAETVTFIPSQKNYSATTRSEVAISYLPDKNISVRNLDSISFDLEYDTDLLDYRSISTSIPGATITLTPPPPSLPLPQRARVIIKGSNMTLDSLQPIATIIFKAMVAKATSTPIIMSNLQLNGGDQNFADCILSADSSNSEFTIIPSCGDTTLRNFLSGIFPTKIISLRPNPAQDEIELEIEMTSTSEMEKKSIAIFDAMGREVHSEIILLSQGSNQVQIDTKDLAGGMYVVRIGTASQGFVKIK